MSTYMYLECLDHDPPLRGDEEVGQHTYDLPDIQRYVADRRRYENECDTDTTYGWPRQYGHHFERNAAAFLVAHRKCRIGIRDQYGRDHPAAPDMCPTQGCWRIGAERDGCNCTYPLGHPSRTKGMR